jgi:DNA-binding MarR family transcriptional regulator
MTTKGQSDWHSAESGQTLVGELARELYEAAAAVRARGEAVAGSAGQSQARWQVLYLLVNQPRSVPSVARRLGLARQSVQRVVDLLAGDGLVSAENNPDHARSPLYALTEEGRATLARINAAAELWHADVLRAFSADELERGRGFLRRLLAVAGEDGPERSR